MIVLDSIWVVVQFEVAPASRWLSSWASCPHSLWRFKLYHHPIWTNARRVPMDACINDACINYVLLRRLRRTVGAPGFSRG